jgi:hypothetical protein
VGDRLCYPYATDALASRRVVRGGVGSWVEENQSSLTGSLTFLSTRVCLLGVGSRSVFSNPVETVAERRAPPTCVRL